MAKYRCVVCNEVEERKVIKIKGKSCVQCEDCDIYFPADAPIPDGPIRAKLYSHSSKDSNADKGDELGLSDKAMEKFCYALYEVEFDVEINRETGKVMITAVNGMELREPVEG